MAGIDFEARPGKVDLLGVVLLGKYALLVIQVMLENEVTFRFEDTLILANFQLHRKVVIYLI